MRRALAHSVCLILTLSLLAASAGGLNEQNEEGPKVSQTIYVEVHRIMQLDEIDLFEAADWYCFVGIDEGYGYSWQQSPITYDVDHFLPDHLFTFVVNSPSVSVALYLVDDDGADDDLADISAAPGNGANNFVDVGNHPGAVCTVSYDIINHTWTGDVNGSTSEGYCETNGEWDGTGGLAQNDAAVWFMIWDHTRVNIESPVFAVPLIEEMSAQFDIVARVESVGGPSEWNATISTEFDNCPLMIDNVALTGANTWTLTVHTPPDARCDLYDLTITVDGVSDIEPNSVSLIPSFSTDMKFIQITDLHITDLASGSAEADTILSVIEEINLINPAFVIASGDIGDNPVASSQNEVYEYEVVRNVLSELRVPVYIVSGNHDNDDDANEPEASITNYWDIVNPYPDFSWDYGQYHFVGLDSGEKTAAYPLEGRMMGTGLTTTQMNWLQSDLALHPGSTSFLFMHHTSIDPDDCPDFPYLVSTISQNQPWLMSLCNNNNVAMVLSGHTHIDEVWDRNEVKQTGEFGSPAYPVHLQTRSVARGSNGYRLIRVSGGAVANFTYDSNGDGNRDAESSIPAGQLTVNYAPDNNGSSEVVTATVQNDLNEYFRDMRLVFEMKKMDPGVQYIATNGTVEQIIRCQDRDVYYVKTDVPKQSEKSVTLSPCKIELDTGWNLISLPLDQQAYSLEGALSTIAGKWDMTQTHLNGTWHTNSTDRPDILDDLQALERTMGVWLHATEPCTLYVKGTPQPQTNIQLYAGWNLVGYPSATERTVADALAGTGYDAVEGYNATAPYNISPLSDNNKMRAGEGYWVRVSADTVWAVNW